MGARHGVLVLAAALVPGLAAAALPAGDAGDRWVLAAGAAGALSLLAAWRLWRSGRWTPPGAAAIAVGALVLRLLVWAGPVRFDDDLWRYLWDGAATLAGVSPYRFAPLAAADFDPELDPLILGEKAAAELGVLAARAEDPAVGALLPRINFPHLSTIYPPASQLAFAAAAAAAPGGERFWRAVALAADVAVVLLLMRLLTALKRPVWWAASYALHPLPALEFAAAGHQDSLGIACLLAAVLALIRLRRAAAGAWLAAAAGVKLFPALLALAWARRLGGAGALAFAAAALVLALPFAVMGLPDPGGLTAYLSRWEFFSGPYAVLGAAGRVLGLDEALPGEALGGRLLLVVALAGAAAALWKRFDGLGRGWLVLELLLVLSPVVDPWYVAWGLAAGAVRGSVAWPVFALLVPVSYFGLTAEGHPWGLRILAWGPFLLLWCRELLSPSRTRTHGRRPPVRRRRLVLGGQKRSCATP
jgi:hypothetical protein